ncbi:MAG: serine protease, partial [Planctomycetaceae bacterium]
MADSPTFLSLRNAPELASIRHRQFGCRQIAIIAVACLMQSASLSAQTVCLPLPRLLSATPMGAQVGTSQEITLTGENLDLGGELLFSNPHISASRIMQEDGTPDPLRYRLTISADCQPGLCEMRVMTRLGISSSRIFVIGELPEVLQEAGNTAVEKAMTLQLNTICNARVTARNIDFYSFHAEAGQRLLIHCDARGVESKLQPVMTIASTAGVDLKVERQGGPIDFLVPETGEYRIRIHD